MFRNAFFSVDFLSHMYMYSFLMVTALPKHINSYTTVLYPFDNNIWTIYGHIYMDTTHMAINIDFHPEHTHCFIHNGKCLA
jgi:hypothetical protein